MLSKLEIACIPGGSTQRFDGTRALEIYRLVAFFLFVCVFMALITTLAFCARCPDLVMSVSVRRVHVVLSTLPDLRADESRVVRHVKPPRCGEASSRPHALRRVRTQDIGALAQGSYPLSYPSAERNV